ncbi:FAD-dependent oxidoreductase [Streptomyces albus]|uniref:FAD-dependent oxidoreductase n=1 Tax=Streptomyces albus TaxID=1888 RepID=UPI0006E412F8|nr:FAD-dependent oxidoreductase [Streptomyces albus]
MSERDGGVLVVGGGLVGLAAGAFLAQQGVEVTVAERHRETSRHPKARLVNVRSMELYRALGIDGEIRAAGEPSAGFAVADSLAGPHESWIAPPEEAVSGEGLSPVAPYSCDQQRIEPILRKRATALGARVLFGTEVTDIQQHDGGVTARLLRPGGEQVIRARFLVAADGARSPIRTALGIGLDGEAVPGTAVSALFRADVQPALRGRWVDALMARDAGAFLFARGDKDNRTWQLGTHLREHWTADDPEGLARHLVPVIRAATGLPDLNPEIESVLTWTTGAYTAEQFRHGRIFLAGDAAHQMPPYGGFGGNTGVQDAHNLAWKLAAAYRGDASDALLDTYHTERAPLVALTVAQALLRSRKTPGQPAPAGQLDATALALGFRYQPPGTTAPDKAAAVEDPAAPSGQPGTRAAHVDLHTGPAASTLDLLDPTAFTFVASASSRIASVLERHPVPGVRVRTVDTAIKARDRQRWENVYDGPRCDGVLIRPDQVIAWRAPKMATDCDVPVQEAIQHALQPDDGA